MASQELSANEIVTEEGLKRMCGEFDLESILYLDLSNRDLFAYGSVILCTSLQILNLSGNRLSSPSPLAPLTSVEELDLSDNELTDLNGLENLHALQKLDLPGNRLGHLDALLPLTHTSRLSSLTLRLPSSSLTNPLCSDTAYSSFMAERFPHLIWLDTEQLSGPGAEFYALSRVADARLQESKRDEEDEGQRHVEEGAVVDPLEDSAPTDEEAFAEISRLLDDCSDTSQKLQEHISALRKQFA